MIQISVLIVNYNTAAEVIDCVDSVLCQQGLNFDVWVIDNASQDDSVARLRQRFGTRIQIIANPTNVGFGRANNIGAEVATGEYLYFLNPDAQLTRPENLKTLYDFAKAQPAYGLIGTRVIHTATRQAIAPAYQYPSQRYLKNTPGLDALPGAIAWLQGSSMLMRKALFSQLAGFDPDYFLYAEETDLCLRVRKAGHAIAVCSDVSVEHIGGASQRLEKIAATRLRKQQGLYLFYQKHYSAADSRRLAERALRHSRLRLLWLGWLSRFSPRKAVALVRQQVIAQAAREFLDNHPAT